MDIVSPNLINNEFYSSESDFTWAAQEEQKKLDDKNNKIDSDEVRQAAINRLTKAVEFSKSFTSK